MTEMSASGLLASLNKTHPCQSAFQAIITDQATGDAS